MSLGLTDLKKKRSTVTRSTSSATKNKRGKANPFPTPMDLDPGNEHPAGAWAARSFTARPWNDEILMPRSPKMRRDLSDVAMSLEWMELLSESVAFEFLKEGLFFRLQSRIGLLEEQIFDQVIMPLRELAAGGLSVKNRNRL